MAPFIPPPDTGALLLPLLACLPTAFVSPRAPPALLPLLSPVLRQRVKLLSDTSNSSDSSWLPLLCWESADASELVSLVENASWEPHPVSGEIEFGDIDRIQYRRLDEETLQSIARLPDMGLTVTFLWCEGDQEGGGTGWRVSEVGSLENNVIGYSQPWWNTMSEADEKLKNSFPQDSMRQNGLLPSDGVDCQEVNYDDEDDYWAQYDQTPSRTPAPNQSSGLHAAHHEPSNEKADSDINYYAKYAQIQPALDSDDPSIGKDEIGQSSLNGNSLILDRPSNVYHQLEDHSSSSQFQDQKFPSEDIIHTRPSSSNSSSIVAQLESSAESQSHAEVAIQHHLSTSMKSLYRLARSVGIENSEFQRLVRTELEILGMLDDE